MAVNHIIPVDEPTDGHTMSRKCKCNPDVQVIGGGKMVSNRYMNNTDKKEETNGS